MISGRQDVKRKSCLHGTAGKLLCLETAVTQPPDEELGRAGRELGVLRLPMAVRHWQSTMRASGYYVQVGASHFAKAIALPVIYC